MSDDIPHLFGFWANVFGLGRAVGFVVLVLVMSGLHALMRVFLGPSQILPKIMYRAILWLFSIRVRVKGEVSGEVPTLFVSNHVSYLDIPVLGAVIPAFFVAKADVANWPLIGPITKIHNTVFIERRAVRAAEQRDALGLAIQKQSLILFPEGTSSEGQRVLPFKSSLFSMVEKPLPDGRFITVQPVSLVCTEFAGLPMCRMKRPTYAWFGDMTFVDHLWDVLRLGGFTVEVTFHPTVTMHESRNRKAMADHCQRMIAHGVERGVTGRVQRLNA